MKNRLNIILLISFLIAIILTFWINSQLSKRVGDINFDKEFDSATFKICDEKRIFQYYSSKSGYQNGPSAIKKEIWKDIQDLTFKNSGYITFRFIINCNGEIGRFRVKTIDNNLKETAFDKTKIEKLQTSIKNLKNWTVGTLQEKTVDSYFLLNFRIEDGKITEIF